MPYIQNSPLNSTCWKGYRADGKKKSPSGKKTASGRTKMVNNCVPIKMVSPLSITDEKYEKQNKKMRSDYTKETGKTLGSRKTSGKSARRVKFACRFSGMKGSMKDKSGGPSNLNKALEKWGFSNKQEAASFCSNNKKS